MNDFPRGTRVVVRTPEGDCWCEGEWGSVLQRWPDNPLYTTVQLDSGSRFAARDGDLAEGQLAADPARDES